jgi:dTDP-4-amino-4,6-dideoxygalactose transaminase
MDITETACEQVLTLPLHSEMNANHVQRVIDGVTSFFN